MIRPGIAKPRDIFRGRADGPVSEMKFMALVFPLLILLSFDLLPPI